MIPFARTKYNLIIENLYMGGHDWQEEEHGPILPVCVVPGDFDYEVTLFDPKTSLERRRQEVDYGSPDIIFPIRDGVLPDEDIVQLRVVADDVVGRVQRGQKTLVRCQAGYNRSGLLVAFVLMRMGWLPEEAVLLIKKNRSPWALCNMAFLDYVREEGKRLGLK